MSERQIQASRENGKRSRGPITAEGKQRSSQNSIRHGLCAKMVVLKNERKQNYTRLLRNFSERFAPADQFEEAIVEDLAATYWRMRRIWSIETNLLNESLPEPGNGDDNFDTQMSRTGASYISLAGKVQFASLQRHEAHFHVAFQRSLRTLLALRKAETKEKRSDEPECPK